MNHTLYRLNKGNLRLNFKTFSVEKYDGDESYKVQKPTNTLRVARYT